MLLIEGLAAYLLATAATGEQPASAISGPEVSAEMLDRVARSRPATIEAMPMGNPANWVSPDDYPLLAWLNLESGVTAYDLGIDSKGIPIKCDISASSGNNELDGATCALLMERARFVPSKDARGNPAASVFAGTVRWNIPLDGRNIKRNREETAKIAVDINSNGTIHQCSIIENYSEIEHDPCKEYKSGSIFHTIEPTSAPLPQLKAIVTETRTIVYSLP